MITAAITFFLILGSYLVLGLSSARKSKGDRNDYYLASNSVSPWLSGLSAVATNNSGYMFIGVIGFTYETGLAAFWLMFGWIVGDYIGSTFVHRRLRRATTRTGEASFAAVIAHWYGEKFGSWQKIAALVMILFLISYAAAQISAGGKALDGVLGIQPWVGAVMVATIVLLYSIAGGIRATIWTDAAQSFTMLFAMGVLFFAALSGVGGISGAITKWQEIPGFLDLFPDDLLFPGAIGFGLFIIGWLFAGFSVVGQPHVMIRFMALDNERNMVRARAWYYSYFTLFYLLATGVGLLSRLYLPDLADIDPELALPLMATELLPNILVGVILAGIFAATMSTADSLVLSCSSAFTHDLMPQRLETVLIMKLATTVSILIALGLALADNQSVFSLVILSWSTLASAFAPLLTLYSFRRKLSEPSAILIMLIGTATALFWRFGLGWHESIYEGLPGIVVPLIIGWALSRKAQIN